MGESAAHDAYINNMSNLSSPSTLSGDNNQTVKGKVVAMDDDSDQVWHFAEERLVGTYDRASGARDPPITFDDPQNWFYDTMGEDELRIRALRDQTM